VIGGGRATGLVHAVLTRRHLLTGDAPTTWATAVERFAHGVYRYHDRVEVIADRGLRAELQAGGELLDHALATVRGAGRGRGADDAGRGVRNVLRAGTLVGGATEAAVAAATARRSGDADAVNEAVEEARRLAQEVADLLG
jgi:hypothetical protein